MLSKICGGGFVARSLRVNVVGALLALVASTLGAQTMTPTLRASQEPLVMRVDSLTARGDTTQALAVLAAAVLPRSTNAAVWHRYGVLLWQSVAANRRGGYMRDTKVTNTVRLADSALRLATQFAPDSAQYWITLAQFSLQSDMGPTRFAGSQQMANAQSAAERAGDSAWLALAADEVGLAAWRRRETTANRAFVGAGQRMQLQTNGRFPRARAKDYLASFANKIEPPTGRVDFETALAQFRRASATAPSNLTYSRHLFMVLATGERWEELLSVATQRASASAFDGQARFGRAVALHRLGRPAAARAAFDSALAMMDDAERLQLFRLDRLLPPGANVLTGVRGMDAPTLRALPPAQRETMSALYWALNDPRSATPENEAELEFYARVVQADWSWTDDMLARRGADTDRGDIFIRYGPPDNEMTLLGTASVQQDESPSKSVLEGGSTVGGMTSTSQDGGATLAWLYRSGDAFFFDLSPGFGTARIPLTDQQFVSDVASIKPATWENVGGPLRVDSVPLRATRFRASRDSADVVLVAQIPSASLAEDGSRESQEIRVDLRLVDGAARVYGRDTVRATAQAIPLSRTTWVRRMGVGATFVRIDAVQASTNRAANALLPVAVEGGGGFGLSDLLLTRVDNANATARAAARWSDLEATPSTGVYRVGEKIGVVWETYALADSAEANRYTVTLAVQRIARRGAAGLALRVLDGVGGLLTEGRGNGDQLTIAFDRVLPIRMTQVDVVALDGLGTSAGAYTLRLTVTDRVTQRTATRTTTFTVRD